MSGAIAQRNKSELTLQIFWFTLIAEGTLQLLVMILMRHSTKSTSDDNPPHSTPSLLSHFDPLGISLSIPGLILFVYGLTTGNLNGWSEASVVATLVISVLLLAAFVFVELKVAQHPLIPRYLWSDRIKASGCLIAALTYAVWQAANYLLTLELQGLASPHSTSF